MKLTNLIALPFAMIADAVTFGEAGMTRDIIADEHREQDIRAMEAVAKLAKELKEAGGKK